MRKRVEYCYPSSENAERFGFGKTGCYAIEIEERPNPPIAVVAFATVEEARSHAKKIQIPWHELTK